MESITAAIKSVCIVSAAVCIIESLTAGTKFRNQMKLILNLILIIVITYPLLKGSFELELPDITQYEFSDYSLAESVYNEEMLRATAENISSVLRSQLEAAGIKCDKIETSVNISETNSISISSVTISTGDFEAAAEIIRNSLGSETEVLDGNL